jgi:acetolactate synthase-1/2/3 large subunit
MHQLCDEAATAYVADVGQHQMWAAQSLELSGEQRFLTSGGMGAMGSGLPLAVGAAVESGGPVVAISGDGGFQLNIQELQTVARNQLPLKMVVLDNGCHGMVRQFQESYFDGRYQSTVWGYSAPSFVAVANAYGIPGRRVEEPGDVAGAVAEMWATEGPYLLEAAIDLNANAYPKIAFGHPISEMEPFVAPRAMEST